MEKISEKELLLGIDVGSTTTKIVVYDSEHDRIL